MAATRMIRLLGRPTADDAVRVRGNKPWAIAAYLALGSAPVSRDRLISLLFDEVEDPAKALRWNLTQARRLIGRTDSLVGNPLSIPRGTGLVFDVDLLIAGRWPDAAEPTDLGAELLEGMQFPSCPMFETWLLGERRHLRAIAEAMLYEASLNAISVGDLAEAVRLASRLVLVNPHADAHQELLIRAFALTGDTVAARRQLQTAVRVFRHDLGCDPQPSVFLAVETTPAKAVGRASPTRVRALLEAGQAQVVAGAKRAAIQVFRTACDEAQRTADTAIEATAQHALGAALIDAGTQHDRKQKSRCSERSSWHDNPTSRRSPRRHTGSWPPPTSSAGATRAPSAGSPPQKPSRSPQHPNGWNCPPSAASASSTRARSATRSRCSPKA